MNIAAGELHRNLRSPQAPLLLDVRNADEYARWRIESPEPDAVLNLPYFEFVEREDASVEKVRSWIAGRPLDMVVICAKGGASDYVAGVLRDRALPALNLDGGMIAWGDADDVLDVPTGPEVQAWQVCRFGKGCLSYVIAVGRDAMVVDPHRHTPRYSDFLKSRGLTLRAVFDTHLHADHISGGPALSRETGAPYFANALDFEGATFPFVPIRNHERIKLGALAVEPIIFVHTPGHTPGSTILTVQDSLLLTGDTLFVESAGRPDLGGKAHEWGSDLYWTLHERLRPCSGGMLVLPAHYSSKTEVGPGGIVSQQLGVLRRTNEVFRMEERAFIARILETAGSAPPQYARIRRVNLGLDPAPEEDRVELDLGKNECALARRPA